ncbi:MAG: protein phosphatase 2C domain-containing protein, partial [Clostridia bacterium]|nr:protein phosphatase 2C domain-containing protein [Clostridia bacterium]
MALKNYDYIYTIGHSHRTCDDFAYSYSCDGFNISIVCDGCSSAKNSDIGARMIASNFIVEFKTRIKSERESCISSSNIISSLENTIKKTYIDYRDIYGDEFLASTIMVAIST